MEKESVSVLLFKALAVTISPLISGSLAVAGAVQPAPTGEIRISSSSLGIETLDPVLTSDSGKS